MNATHTTHTATHTSGLSAAHKLNYAVGKIGFIPAFGDFIGKDVTKAELSLARSYVQSAAESYAELLAALELAANQFDFTVTALAKGQTVSVSSLQNCAANARAAISRAKGQA